MDFWFDQIILIPFIAKEFQLILAKSLVHVGPSFLKQLTGNPRDDEEILWASLKMMVNFRKLKFQGLLVFEKLHKEIENLVIHRGRSVNSSRLVKGPEE